MQSRVAVLKEQIKELEEYLGDIWHDISEQESEYFTEESHYNHRYANFLESKRKATEVKIVSLKNELTSLEKSLEQQKQPGSPSSQGMFAADAKASKVEGQKTPEKDPKSLYNKVG